MNSRYRLEDGANVIDVRIGNLEQLFDNRDPAPFRERDLDPDLIEYLTAAGEDLASHGPCRVVFWVGNPKGRDEIEPAYRAHFQYELERLDRRWRRHRRTGEIALILGISLLAVLLTLAQLARGLSSEPIATVVGEGLTILSWVVMWRPVEALIYDWLPVRRERRILQHLHKAAVDIREREHAP